MKSSKTRKPIGFCTEPGEFGDSSVGMDKHSSKQRRGKLTCLWRK